MNIILIGLADEIPEQDEKYELHRLIGTLLSDDLTSVEKLDIIHKEYEIPIEDAIREAVSTMCNLSEGLVEKAEARGREITLIALYKV